MCASAASALTGSLSVLALKTTIMGISGWAAPVSVFPPPLSICALLFMVIFGWLQLYLLNVALSSGQAMFAVPLYLSLICVFISLLSGMLFGEFASLTRGPYPLFLVLYALGLLLVLVALSLLAYSQKLKSEGTLKISQAPAPEPEPASPGPSSEVFSTRTV